MMKKTNKTGVVAGFVEPPEPTPGTCTIFSAITGNKTATGATSMVMAKPKVTLWPSWPASSPWVTSVGATRFVGQKVGNEEMATDQFGSGGGFSTMFPAPSWQAAETKAYLAAASMLPPAGSYPPGGRATPDVSALGEGYMVGMNGNYQPVGGTSASTPAFSGLISLINDARLKAGKKPMGFLNPWIYQNTDCFTDVTKGTNRFGRGPFKIPYGFNATKGWDPVTGVGTPLFDKMLAAALK
jgi:tripeptidyl-peptidase-1